MAALLQAPPANEECSRSRCPARATDTVVIKNVDGEFYFCHHHASEVPSEKVAATFSVIPTQEKINVRHHQHH